MQKKIALILSLVVFFSSFLFISARKVSAETGDLCCDSNEIALGEICYPTVTFAFLKAETNFVANQFCKIFACEDPDVMKDYLYKQVLIIAGSTDNEKEFAKAVCTFSPPLIDDANAEWLFNIFNKSGFNDACKIGVRAIYSDRMVEAISNAVGTATGCEKTEICYNNGGTGVCVDENSYDVCKQIESNPVAYTKCITCFSQDPSGIWTGLGCIPTDPIDIVQTLLRIGLMLGGGVALLIILAGSFILSTSQGDPKRTSEAKDMITAAIIGIIFIIFSISILQLIGVQILQIPGFGVQ